MTDDFCQTVFVDGEPILVRVTTLLTPDEVEAFAWIVRAAKRKHAADHPEPPMEGKQGKPTTRRSAPRATQTSSTTGRAPVAGSSNTLGKVDGGVGEMRPSPVVGTCAHLHQIDEGDDMGWVCADCGKFVDP